MPQSVRPTSAGVTASIQLLHNHARTGGGYRGCDVSAAEKNGDSKLTDLIAETGIYEIGNPDSVKEAVGKAVALCRLRPNDIPYIVDEVVARLKAKHRSEARKDFLAKAALPSPTKETDTGETSQAIDLDADRLYEQGRELLEATDQLEVYRDEISEQGFAGPTETTELVYVAFTSSGRDKPVSLGLLGATASGKNENVDRGEERIPPEAVYAADSMSEHAIIFSDRSFKNVTIVLREFTAVNQDGSSRGSSLIRGIISSNKITYRGSKDGEAVDIEKEGPTSLIFTTTRVVEDEMDSRVLSASPREGPVQTRAICKAIADEVRPDSIPTPQPDFTAWLACQRWLRTHGEKRIVVPYADYLAETVPAEDTRMNRDFRQIIQVICTLAFMHQKNRERDRNGSVVANLDDYKNAYRLLKPVLAQTLEGVSPATREAIEGVAKLNQADGVSYVKLGEALKITSEAARKRCATALRRRYLVNKEAGQKGRAARLTVGDKLPDAKAVIPNPAEVEEWLRAQSGPGCCYPPMESPDNDLGPTTQVTTPENGVGPPTGESSGVAGRVVTPKEASSNGLDDQQQPGLLGVGEKVVPVRELAQ